MGLTERLNRAAAEWLGIRPARSSYPYSMDDYLSWLTTAGATFPLYGTSRGTLAQPNEEPPDGSYESLVTQAYRANGVVFAVEMSRLMLFTEARFMFQRLRAGEPGELFLDAPFPQSALRVLETPWEGGTTGDLLGRMIVDADFGGTGIVVRRGDELDTLSPDKTIIVGAGSHGHRVLGAAYFENGIQKGGEPELFMRPEVAIFRPVIDPVARFRGMPWLIPIINDVLADKALVQHKLNYFRNGATVNQVVTFDPGITPAQFDEWVDKFSKAHANNRGQAFKTLYLGAGAKYNAIGSTPQEIDLKAIQGAIETRIAAAGMVPPIIVGLSEGLASATYSNYGMARRKYADATLRPLWRFAAGALQSIIPTPPDARLWYNDKDIPFLQEDAEDAARIDQIRATTIRTLWDGGADPQSVIDTIAPQWSKTLRHTGKLSVQLQEPGTQPDSSDAGRALASLIAPHLPKPPEVPALPEPDTKRAIERARQALIESGVARPTQAQIAEHLGVSDRTVRRWEQEAA